MKTRVITVANNKGGVAKTTTVFNVGKCLAGKGKKVLLIDLDPQANLSTMAGIEKDTMIEKSISQIFVNKDINIKSLILRVDDIDVLISSSDLLAASENLIAQGNKDHRLETKLKEIINENLYDYILIDTPPNFGILTRNGIIASTEIIIPIQAEFLALQGTADILSFVNAINDDLQELERPLKRINGAIVTMYDQRTSLSKDIDSTARAGLKENGIDTFITIINKNTKIAEAPRENKSIFDYDKNSQGAKDYEALTNEIVAQELKGVA